MLTFSNIGGDSGDSIIHHHIMSHHSITPALRQLHWQPVRQHIQYKLASLAFRALSGLAPDYLAGDCQLVADSGRRSLRSAERRVCSVPRQNSTFGERSFMAAGPRAWNELPFSLRDAGLSLTTFNAHLKTYFFLQRLRPRHFCDIYDFFVLHINVLTYLLTYTMLPSRPLWEYHVCIVVHDCRQNITGLLYSTNNAEVSVWNYSSGNRCYQM